MATTKETAKQWNPRWVAFAASQGKSPEDLERSRVVNASFMAWIRAKWVEFAKAFGRSTDHHSEQDHADFDAWLQKGGAA